jgi:hypothetical protein
MVGNTGARPRVQTRESIAGLSDWGDSAVVERSSAQYLVFTQYGIYYLVSQLTFQTVAARGPPQSVWLLDQAAPRVVLARQQPRRAHQVAVGRGGRRMVLDEVRLP